jgi:RNA polymerase sigma-70 factor (ECF subfamily)
LFTIVRRKLADWWELQERHLHGSGNTTTQRVLEQRPAPEGTEAEWEDEWEKRLFAWACEQVRPDVSDATWHAFWQTAVDGRPGKEVAAELGLSVAAVYLARSRVLAKLKELVRSAQEP